jgi:hypothetical protein
MNPTTRIALLFAALATAAPTAHGQFTGVSTEVTLITFNGAPHTLLEISLDFAQANDAVLNVFDFQGPTLVGPGSIVHFNAGPPNWSPALAAPPGGDPTDSAVRVGGPFSPASTTSPDPGWREAGFTQPSIPSGAGWFNSVPPNLQGQAGADLKTPIMRLLVAGNPTQISVAGQVGYFSGLGTPVIFASFSATVGIGEPIVDCNGNGIADEIDLATGVESDCNVNAVPDSCDIASGLLGDADANGVPDVCETLPEVVVGPITNPANCHRYYLLAESSWTLAQDAALALGGHLVVINDAAENAWVAESFLPLSSALWIGLSDAASEGVFEWVDGSPVGYTNWAPFEPNNCCGGEDYVHIWPGSTWNDSRNILQPNRGVVEVAGAVADINCDGSVDATDLTILLAAWGTADPTADIDDNGVVDASDLTALLAGWGTGR